MITAVDTSVLIAIAKPESDAHFWIEILAEAQDEGDLVICDVGFFNWRTRPNSSGSNRGDGSRLFTALFPAIACAQTLTQAGWNGGQRPHLPCLHFATSPAPGSHPALRSGTAEWSLDAALFAHRPSRSNRGTAQPGNWPRSTESKTLREEVDGYNDFLAAELSTGLVATSSDTLRRKAQSK
jgi:hypothetical protein